MAETISIATHRLKADTQAVLLLCGRFGQQPDGEAKPLTQSEYDKLAEWLRQHDLRPSGLLTGDGLQQLSEAGLALPVDLSRLKLLLERGGALAMSMESWSNRGLWVISRSDGVYPQRLKGRLGPPILYGAGNPRLLELGGLAIVGSRDADEAEVAYTRRVARACAEAGVQVVSGGARGVDGEAMQTALEAGGTAVGVLADSLLRSVVSSKYRNALLEERLALVSPYDPGAGFDVGNAMGRNKHIYALADYALIVSASAEKGGTWAGAVEALKAAGRRAVFVRVIENGDTSEGNLKLIEKGARPFPAEPWANLAQLLTTESAQRDTLPMESLYASPELSQGAIQSPGHTVNETNNETNVFVDANPFAPNTAPSMPDTLGTPQLYASEHVAEAGNIYDAVLPVIIGRLKTAVDAKTLAERLEVRQPQLQDWLNRVVREGQVTKLKKPVRYVSSAQAQLDLT